MMPSREEFTNLVKESYCRGDKEREEILKDPDAIEMIEYDYAMLSKELEEGVVSEEGVRFYAVNTTAYTIELYFG